MAARIFYSKQSRQIAIAPTLTQARLVFNRVVWMLGALGLTCTTVVTPHPQIRIKGVDERLIHVLDARSGHEAVHLRGDGAEHVLLDESAYLPEQLITEVAMRMLAASDGRMTMISTPRGRNSFYRFFLMGERGENGFWSRRSPSVENPLVSESYLALQKEILTENAFRVEYEAEFLDSQTAVFKSDRLSDALIAPPVEDGPIFVGIDWARCRDYTSVVAVRGTRDQAEVIGCARWTNIHWDEQVRKAGRFAAAMRATEIICDATGGGDPVAEQLERLLPEPPVNRFVFTRPSKQEIIEGLVWMLERRALRLPADVQLLRELEHFEAIPGEGGLLKYGAPEGFHDDMVCALALACSKLEWSHSVEFLMRARG